MKNIFPNIEIFAQRSKMPELTEFYFSYMWSIVILMVMLIALIIPKVKAEAKIFFRILMLFELDAFIIVKPIDFSK